MIKVFEEVKRIRKAHYHIVHELWDQNGRSPRGTPPLLMKSAYSPEGLYLGKTRLAHRLVTKYGITDFYLNRRSEGASVASIGYAPKSGKWYGWSHRAIHGFRGGDLSKKGHMPNMSREYVIRDARRAAESFAAEVS